MNIVKLSSTISILNTIEKLYSNELYSDKENKN